MIHTGFKMSGLSLILMALLLSMSAIAIEEPRYTVLEKIDDRIEVRQYEAQVVAVTPMSESQNNGFRVLAGYIFGGNDKDEKIAMTAPVATTMAGDQREMTFMMPNEYTLESLPKPLDGRVDFRSIPAYTAAVIRFSGRANGSIAEEKWLALKTVLEGTDWQIVGQPTLNQYNPPWTLGFLRRNEIIVPVTASDSQNKTQYLLYEDTAMTDSQKLKVAQDMLDAWNTLDWPRVYELFGEDGVLSNMMTEPVVGAKAIQERFATFEKGLSRMEFIVLNMGMLGEDVVIERLDSFDFEGRTGIVPVMGILTIEKGQVKEWREYYDRAWLLSEMGVIEGEPPHPLAPRDSVLASDMTDQARLAVAQAMLDAYERLDWPAAAALIAEEGQIHYAEPEPMVGPQGLLAHTARLGDKLSAVKFTVRNIGVVNGTVMTERIDHIEFNGVKGAVPVFGAMEIENGKIQQWREYFDHHQMLSAMGFVK